MGIDSEKRPTGEAPVDRALHPCHGSLGVPERAIHTGDLMVGLADMAEGVRRIQCLSDALWRLAGFASPAWNSPCTPAKYGSFSSSSAAPAIRPG
jgi:hypothetical protein